MTELAIDSKRQDMRATGNVSSVMEWVEVGGKRKQSDEQMIDPNTGMKQFTVEVLYQSSAFGKAITVTAAVQIGATEAPKLEPFSRVEFVDLVCSVFMTQGSMRESWRAERLADGKAAPAAKPQGQAA